jgi:hypothetical protein
MAQTTTPIPKYSVRDAPVEAAPIPPEDIISGSPESGEVAFIPEAIRARWDVHETVRKGFHSHDSTGTLLGPA